ncbi:MAG: hypothetical protein ABGY42_00210 [bacterium]
METTHRATTCLRTFLAALLTSGGLASIAVAGPAPFYSNAPGAPADAKRAIRICETLDSTPPAARAAALEQAISLAERAVRRFPEDARAHFALFCTLGRNLQQEGASVQALFAVRRVRHAVQKAIALQPTYVDALVAHGAMLASLPWLMGGDTDRGEALIRHAIGLDPTFLPAYRELAALLHADGRGDQAPILDIAHAAD